MKKIFLIFLIAFYSCGPDNPTKVYRFKKGDIVYLKPDSAKAVVDYVDAGFGDYSVTLSNTDLKVMKSVRFVDEECIYTE